MKGGLWTCPQLCSSRSVGEDDVSSAYENAKSARTAGMYNNGTRRETVSAADDRRLSHLSLTQVSTGVCSMLRSFSTRVGYIRRHGYRLTPCRTNCSHLSAGREQGTIGQRVHAEDRSNPGPPCCSTEHFRLRSSAEQHVQETAPSRGRVFSG